MPPARFTPLIRAAIAIALVAGLWGAGPARADLLPPYPLFGIGATLDFPEGAYPVVAQVAPGSSAEAAGLQSGDTLLAVGGTYMKADWPEYMRARSLYGPEGSSVTLVVLRGGAQVLVLDVPRTVPLKDTVN